jgi:hypothetical protein
MKKFFKQLFVAILVAAANLAYAQDWKTPLPSSVPNWNPSPPPPNGSGNSQPALDMATPWSLGGNSIQGIGMFSGQINNQADPNYKTTSIGTVDDAPFIMKANNLECIYITPGGLVGLGEENINGGAPVDIWAKGRSTNDLSRLSFFADDRGHIESSVDMTLLFGSGASRVFSVKEGSVSVGGGVHRITALSGGKVGINNPSPQAALDVKGNNSSGSLRIFGDADGNVQSITDLKLHYSSGVTSEFHISRGAPGSATTSLLMNVWGTKINTGGNFYGLFVGPTASPWYNYDSKICIDATTSRGLTIMSHDDNTPIEIWNGSGTQRFRMKINGTASGEDTEFDLRGRMQLGFITTGLTLQDATARLNVEALGSGVKVTTGNPNSKALRVEYSNPNAHDMFVVLGDGRTRIGAGYPDANGVAASASLTVDGMILARDIRVSITQGTHWADYVFDKDYKLMPLEEVEKYVQKNKHLPDVPSEAEVKEEGVDVTSMNIALLKKIEELYLYTIDLKKKSELQEERIEELYKQINADKN